MMIRFVKQALKKEYKKLSLRRGLYYTFITIKRNEVVSIRTTVLNRLSIGKEITLSTLSYRYIKFTKVNKRLFISDGECLSCDNITLSLGKLGFKIKKDLD